MSLTVTDSDGLSDPTPALRMVVVADHAPPDGIIDAPTGPVAIQAGESVVFAGTGIHPDGGLLSYSWDFDGGAPISHLEDPGPVAFETAGIFTVRFRVRDEQGLADPSPPIRVITVETQTPHATIDSPAADLTILPGESVDFQGTGTDPGGHLPLQFIWDFGGAAPASNLEDPGPVTFTTAGTYTVIFNVRNGQGLMDETPDQRIITVVGNQSPESIILEPTADTTIPTGTDLEFSGMGTDPEENTPLTWFWDFGGAAADSTLQVPGPVTFATAGIYTVTFSATDSLGLADPTPDTRVITVQDEEAPEGLIEFPLENVTIRLGETVIFAGSGTDPDGHYPLDFLWDFDGAAAHSNLEDPGPIPFDVSGLFRVSLLVTDSHGLSDPTPDIREVTVVYCPDVVVHSVALGLGDVQLTAVMPCETPDVSWSWHNLVTGEIFGIDENPVILDPVPTESTSYRIDVTDNATGEVGTATARVLAPIDPLFLDFDGDGCNTIEDLWEAASMWLQASPDADGDNLLTITDLLYIHLSDTCL